MSKNLFFLAVWGLSTLAYGQQISLVNLDNREAKTVQGTSWGVPFAKGQVFPDATFVVCDAEGRPIESQNWTLARWPDGSVKWEGLAVVSQKGMDRLSLLVQAVPKKRRVPTPVPVAKALAKSGPDGVYVNTGNLECLFPATGSKIIRDISKNGKLISSDATLLALLERRDGQEPYQGAAITTFEGKVEKVSIVRNGPLCAVIKSEGKHKAGGREWLPFSLYTTVYKGMPTLSLSYSFIFDSDGEEDFIKGLGINFEVPFREEDHNRHVRLAGDGDNGSGFWCEPVRLVPGYRPTSARTVAQMYQEHLDGKRLPDLAAYSQAERAAIETCPLWGDMRLVQTGPGSFSLDKRTTPASSWVHYVDGGRSLGGALLGDCSGSLFVGVKDFWQNYPASLHISHAGEASGGLTAWFWAPEAESMDMRRYDNVGHDGRVTYEDYKEGWGSPYGVAHRTDIEVRLFDDIPSNDELWAVAEAVQKPVQYTCTPEYFYSVHAFGDYWGLPRPENPVCADIEKKLDDNLAFYADQIEQRSWYGFWNYGDVMHNYDFTRHDWRYDVGGWAWNNVELVPNVLLWTCFLRSGREDIWTMAEALEKHTGEVDVHHLGQFAPLGSRHNVNHWGDGCKQPRIGYAAMKRYFYYLTGGDARTGDLMSEQIGSEKAYEYARRISTWGAESGTYLRGSLNDWSYYASNGMLEWERTGDLRYRDKLLASMKDIVALGQLSGRLVFDWFDTESGRFMVWLHEKGVPTADGQALQGPGEVNAPKEEFVPASSLSRKKIGKILGYRLREVHGDTFGTIFGAPEIFSEMRLTIDNPQFWTLTDQFFEDASTMSGGGMSGPRMAAWVSASRNDDKLGARAWKNLLDNGFSETENDGTPVKPHPLGNIFSTRGVVKPYSDPDFLGQTAGWQFHTPGTTQWLLNALEVMEWSRKWTPEQSLSND